MSSKDTEQSRDAAATDELAPAKERHDNGMGRTPDRA